MNNKNNNANSNYSNYSGVPRQRIGNELPVHLPYRDDPQAPPSVRLESFTLGGYGMSDEKPKDYPLHRKLIQTAVDVITCQPCCGGANATTAMTMTTSQSATDPYNIDAVYYEDSFNDLSWSCTAGTADENGIWLNQSDTAGTIMAVLVWVLISYSSLTMTFLAKTNGVPVTLAMGYNILAALALASHCKTTLTDPGAVPAAAVPTQLQRETCPKLSMCSQCQTFKPPASHHCRICNRCISRMDHHCPWMNNCVGAGNLKHFMLFLIYTWTCSVYSLLLLGWNYFFCATEDCVFHIVLVQLVRLVTLLSVGAFLFTSSMLMNVVYGIMTGVGTIDRLKKKAAGTLQDSEEEPIPLRDIFGIGPAWTWFLPVDPVFYDYDAVMGYATPQRLLREQMRAAGGGSVVGGGSSVVTRESYSVPV